MSGGQGKSFINLGSKLRKSIAQQDYGDKYVEFVIQPTDYTIMTKVKLMLKPYFIRFAVFLFVIYMGCDTISSSPE